MNVKLVVEELNKMLQRIQPKPVLITMVKAPDGSYSSGFKKENGDLYLRKQYPHQGSG